MRYPFTTVTCLVAGVMTMVACGDKGMSPASPSSLSLSTIGSVASGSAVGQANERAKVADAYDDYPSYGPAAPAAPGPGGPMTDPGMSPVPAPGAPLLGALTVSIVGTVGSNAFMPNPIPAAMGDMVVFTNSDLRVHHLVLDDLLATEIGTLGPGESSTPMALTSTVATYHCTIHPSMVGTIGTVDPAGAAPSPMDPPATPPDSAYGYRLRQGRPVRR